jgi:hypothetical protein
MQLLKVQERINALPLNAASLSYLDRAAKGMDTEIPPFMALAGMNEMKRNMEYASTGQPPEEPINESLPKQVAQQMGLGQPMQPMQQGQPQGQPMQPPGQLAQGIAQPMQQMARGGLASVRIDPRMFDYGSGGVVSFAAGERVFADSGRFGNADSDQIDPIADDEETSADEDRARLIALRLQQNTERGRVGPTQQTPSDIQAEILARGNSGVDQGPLGAEYLTGLEKIQELKRVERERQAEDNKRRKDLDFWSGIRAAAEATRGQGNDFGGFSAALGGFGAAQNKSELAALDRDAALRGQGITETEIFNEAKSKIQNLRQAKLSGDVAQIVKLQNDIADLANKASTANMSSLSAEITALLRKEAARITAGKGRSPTDLASGVEEGLRAARASGDTRNEDVIRKEVRNALITAGVAVTAGATTAGQVSSANTADKAQTLIADEQKRKTYQEAVKTVDLRLKDFRSNEYRRLRELQDEDEAYNDPKAKGLFGKKPPPPAERQNKAEAYVKKLYEDEAASRPSPSAPAAAAGAAASASAGIGTRNMPRAMVATKDELMPGQYYKTPRGVAKWDGQNFVED